mmetsp:Transcript_11189/g.45536  ORF Transcript_11189/g.45536 Transcript_11189/m.45536 type:complete len:367 (+) Transcript_11189:151-1251(+)
MDMLLDAVQLYDGFVLEHAEQVSTVETLLQGIFNLMPSRMGDNEAQTELVCAAMNVWAVYNDSVFLRKRRRDARQGTYARLQVPCPQSPVGGTAAPPAPIVPRWWEAGMLLLNTVAFSEVVLEIWARQRKRRWSAIIAIELLKAMVKLVLLAKSRGAVQALSKVPPRDYITPARVDEEGEEGDEATSTQRRQGREGKRRTLLDVAREKERQASDVGRWRQYWAAQYSADLPEAEQYTPSMPTRDTVIGELLHIFRPLIYVLLVVRYGRRKWKPWIVSLVVDMLSRYFTRKGPLNEYERETSNSRTLAWLFYLARSPCYEQVVSRAVHAVPAPQCITKRALFKQAYRMVSGISATYRDIYFYTAASD